MKLSPTDVANSNIVALCATLLVRLVAGPSCDRFGPRYTFAGCLLIGAIPTALSGTVTTSGGLMTIRFFVGILGGSFVPCQVWSTGFFDKNIVGTANALTAGFGNSGGGITYFLMPAIFDSLIANSHMTPHVAWRVAFIVPFIVITATAITMLLVCPDTPTGKWSERHLAAQHYLADHGISGDIVDVPGEISEKKDSTAGTESSNIEKLTHEKLGFEAPGKGLHDDHEAQIGEQQMLDTARGEIIRKPTFKEALPVIFSLQSLVTMGCYLCTFGAELSINSILGAYYLKNFKALGQTGSGRWAAMFGLLKVFFRPAGGILSDVVYKGSSVWGKKYLVHTLAILTGVFQIAIGVTDSHTKSTMFGLVAGMALFLEATNGAVFSLVPHVHPHANGLVSGLTGGAGSIGGIIFAVIFRFNGVNYGKVFWIIGVITIGINLALIWVRPIPKGQIGGH